MERNNRKMKKQKKKNEKIIKEEFAEYVNTNIPQEEPIEEKK